MAISALHFRNSLYGLTHASEAFLNWIEYPYFPRVKLTSRCLETPGGSVIGCSQMQYDFFPLPVWRAIVSEACHVSLGAIFVVVDILGRLSHWELREMLKAWMVAWKSKWNMLYPKENSRR